MSTPADLDVVRDWVGMDDPSDSDIYALVDALGTPQLAAQRILNRRKDELEEIVPFSVPGYTQGSPAVAIASIDKKLQALASETGNDVGGDGGSSQSRLTRPDRCRR